MQPKGVRVKEVADFKVFTKGAGSGELKVTVKGPSKCQGPGLERGWGDRGGDGGGAAGRTWPVALLPESFVSQPHAAWERLQRDPDQRHCEASSTQAPLCLSFPVCQLGTVLSAVGAHRAMAYRDGMGPCPTCGSAHGEMSPGRAWVPRAPRGVEKLGFTHH